jgi:hypothetical protein
MWRIAPELALLCAGVTVDRGVLPEWAWTGPQPRMRHVVARDGSLAAVLFGDSLSAPPDAQRARESCG